MSPYQYAVANCSNLRKHICLGVDWSPEGREYRRGDLPSNKVCLIKQDKQCPFFTEIFLPGLVKTEHKPILAMVKSYKKLEK